MKRLAVLLVIGILFAIYCDMGTGWNYSWYRLTDGGVVEIFPTKGRYTTNWITFYKLVNHNTQALMSQLVRINIMG